MLLSEVEERCQPGEGDASVVLRNNADILRSYQPGESLMVTAHTYVLDDPSMQVFPELGRAEDASLLQMWTVYLLDAGPAHELRCCEALH